MLRLSLLLLIFDTVLLAKAGSLLGERTVQIQYEGSNHIDLFWVDPDTSEEVILVNDLAPGVEFSVDADAGHRFNAQEAPLLGSRECENEGNVCRKVYFSISDIEDQTIRITDEFTVEVFENKIKCNELSQLLVTCQPKAQEGLARATDEGNETNSAMDELISCAETGLAIMLEEGNDEITFHASVRRAMAAWLEKYTCGDDSLNSTDNVAMATWFHAQTVRNVHIKLDRPATKIHVIENFINEEECITILEETEKYGQRKAEVSDGKGGVIVLENIRKSMIANVPVDWSKEMDGDPIARLSRRVYDYTNHALGLNIQEHGQEKLKSIQYTGRGMNDTDTDKFNTHCDGVCTRRPHLLGQRVASMVMYCAIAERGGHTNFGNAAVHIKPEKGQAVFLSYFDSATGLMDEGFSQHSGCPMYEGVKSIVLQCNRLGVDRDNPYYSFNALGIKLSDAEVAEARKNPF